MSEFNKYEIEDLIAASVSQKPIEFEQAFDNLIVNRLQSAINDKKIQVAQQIYGYSPEEETESE
jgi:hypothetical protein